jgi:nucleoside-diphosphate-sugar epimerase
MTIDHGNSSDRGLRRVLVVGGGSRAAQAFRRYATGTPDLRITTLVRRPTEALEGETVVEVSDYFCPPDEVLQSADAVINFVGITHGHDDKALRAINIEGPRKLAATAKRLGARHFVQLSSFHVYGYAEDITPETPEAPETPYARSKLTADTALLKMADEQFAVTVFRLPVLYGKGVGDNLRKLAKLMIRVPVFPVSKQPRLRSALHIDNLAVLLEAVVRRRASGIQFGADPEPFTIDLLADVIGHAIGRRPRLAHLPDFVFLPLRLISNGLYRRLYKRNLIEQRVCVAPLASFPISVKTGLKDILPL